jgi:hypothetical protein
MGKVSVIGRHIRAALTRRILLEAGGIFALVIGLFSGIVQLLPQLHFDWSMSAAIFLLSGTAAFIYALVRSEPSQLAADELVPDAAPTPLVLEVSVNPALLSQAHAIALRVYPGIEPMSRDRYEQYTMINPNLLACLLDANRRVVGYFDVFPLREDFFNMLAEGVCDEQAIRHEHILPPNEAACATRIYLGGVAVSEPHTARGRRHAAVLLWGLLKYLEHFYGAPCPKKLFASAATRDGESLLLKFGFSLVSPAQKRKDAVPLYAVELTEEFLRKLLLAIPDWSAACRLAWVPPRPSLRLVAAASESAA